MSVESDVYTAITGDAGMSALIGTRLYPGVIPQQATYPAAAYFVVSEVPAASHGCVEVRVQVSLFATTYAGVVALRSALVSLIESVSHWRYETGPDNYEDDLSLHMKPVDVIVLHEL